MKTVRYALSASLLLAAAAMAQTPITPAPASDATKPPQPAAAAPINLPPWDRLAKLGDDGKVIRVEGILDILAIPRNNFIDAATRERIRPMVSNWMAEVDQLAIDNLDFLEMIERPDGQPGVIEKLELNDNQNVHRVAQMMTQLMSTGPLSNHLEQLGGLNREQSQRNQEIVSDYLQQVMNEIMAAGGTPNVQGVTPQTEEDKVKQVNLVSRFLYGISCRDTLDSYRRQLASSAAVMDKAVASLDLAAAAKAKVDPLLPACKSASDTVAKRKAARAVLDQLEFDQRRAALNKARELAGQYDPLADLPAQGSFPDPTKKAGRSGAIGGSPRGPGGRGLERKQARRPVISQP
jgi:hypothetical protein